MEKRIIAALLALILVSGLVPVFTLAAEDTASGSELPDSTAAASEPAGEEPEPTGEAQAPSGETSEPTGETSEPTGEASEPAGGAQDPAEGESEPVSEAPELSEPSAASEEAGEAAPQAVDSAAVFTRTADGQTSGPMTLAEALTDIPSGAVIDMTADVTLSSWTGPVSGGTFTLNGHGYAIRGLTTPLFAALTGNITIRELTIADSNIQGIYSSHCLSNTNDRTAGAVAAFASGNLKLIGVKVRNSTVDGSHKASFDILGARNAYAGGLIGYNSGGSLLIQDCEVSGVTVKSNNGSAGGLIGHTYGAEIVNTRVSGNTITISNWLNAWKVGGLLGCVQGATAVDVTEVTPSTVKNSSSSGKTHLIGRNYGGAITITGGTYFSDPTVYNQSGAEGTTQVAGGAMVQQPDGTWITQADVSSSVARIGDTGYATLEEAFAAAVSGDTIVLLADIVLTHTILVDKDLTLDLNGHHITD